VRAVASLDHHVHGRQHASRDLQSDGWNRFVAGRATCSMDDQVFDATCDQEVGWVIRWCGAEKPCLPVCRPQAKPHAQIARCVDEIGDRTVKSDRSVVVLYFYHFGLGRTIGFQAAVSDTSGGKYPESSHQRIVGLTSRCLRRIVIQTKQVSGIYGLRSLVSTSVRRLSLHIRFRDVMTAQARPIRRVRSGRHWPSDDCKLPR